jgi:hypothetical protein
MQLYPPQSTVLSRVPLTSLLNVCVSQHVPIGDRSWEEDAWAEQGQLYIFWGPRAKSKKGPLVLI